MLFNVDKCKVMDLRVSNENEGYFMDIRQLEAVVDERNLDVVMQNNLKVSKQYRTVIGTAIRVLGMIYETFTCKSRDIISPLYKRHPHLEYCVQAWCPHLKNDIDLIEKVPRRATRMIAELRHLPYEERLQSLGLMSMVKRRLRENMLKVFKILNGIDNVDR